MDLQALTPDGDLLDASTPLREALRSADSPWNEASTRRQLVASLRHGWDGEPGRSWVGILDGEPVALGGLWGSTRDNRDHAWLGVEVHPAHRRRGLGSELLARLEEVARADDRPKVAIGGWESDAGAAIAARHGYTWAAQDVQRRQHLAACPDGWRDELARHTAGAAAAYELIELAGPIPDDLLAPMVTLWSAINDAPTDELDVEDEVFDADRIRGYEGAQAAAGIRLHHVIARHRESGELAGHTVVGVEEERPHRAHQHDTSVTLAHRGHRLGYVLKARMMDRLLREEPQVTTVDTWNAESNSHMIAVNEALGYRAVGRSISYQKTLG